MGLEPVAKGGEVPGKFPYVVFSAPPSGSQDYGAEVSLWEGVMWCHTAGVKE